MSSQPGRQFICGNARHNAKRHFIGFTGTPLLKADRKTTMELFGGYIHTYKFNEAVEDKVVLNLLYEARDVNQRLGSEANIDKLFEARAKP